MRAPQTAPGSRKHRRSGILVGFVLFFQRLTMTETIADFRIARP
jgi:hypothetical protein